MNRDPAPTKVDPLKPEQAAALDRDGYLLLRGAVPAAWRDALRAAFDSGVGTGDQWAAPRGAGWRHALVDLDPMVSGPAACRRCWRRGRRCWAVPSSSPRSRAASRFRAAATSPCIAMAPA
ncbi:hypothetical protein [Bradyrhizobium diazoefficiens]|uniref:hypothetical protein n=1 Tax=Bradyrhizobium diazoefficiens TaxID=1355477 RepID=UPI0020117591|nr:hypothetical protein [Bradyrhizobium diazoefficiens]